MVSIRFRVKLDDVRLDSVKLKVLLTRLTWRLHAFIRSRSRRAYRLYRLEPQISTSRLASITEAR